MCLFGGPSVCCGGGTELSGNLGESPAFTTPSGEVVNLEENTVISPNIESKDDDSMIQVLAMNDWLDEKLTGNSLFEAKSIDITLEIDGKEYESLETNGDFEITVPVEIDSLNFTPVAEGYSRTYIVGRNHTGDGIDAVFEPEVDLENGVILISSNKFSLFTITYRDEKILGNTPVDSTASNSTWYDSRDINRDGVVTCDESNGVGWTWDESQKACVLTAPAASTTTETTNGNSYQLVNTLDK